MIVYALAGVAALAVAGAAAWIAAPHFLEHPEYAVVERDGTMELRDYPALLAAEVRRRGPRREAVRQGFGPLAAYIFAREREGPSIAMTAPVTQRLDPDEGAWAVQFIMPSAYTRETLPEPASEDVRFTEIPAQRRAAIRFSGVATDALIAEKEAALRAWIDARGLTPGGTPVYAYYNDPMTPGFFRRNEILIDVGAAR